MKKLLVLMQIVLLIITAQGCETQDDSIIESTDGSEEVSDDSGSFIDGLFEDNTYRKIHLTLNLQWEEDGAIQKSEVSEYPNYSTGNAEFDLIFKTGGGEAVAQNGHAYLTSYGARGLEDVCVYNVPEEFKGTPEEYDTTGIVPTLESAYLDLDANTLSIKTLQYDNVTIPLGMVCAASGYNVQMDLQDGFMRLFERVNMQSDFDFAFKQGYGEVSRGDIEQSSCSYQTGGASSANTFLCSGGYVITDFGEYERDILKGMGEL